MGKAPPKRASPVRRFVSEDALKHLECVTWWEQVCAADSARHHMLEVQGDRVKYLTWADGDAEYTVVGGSRKVLQLAPPGSRKPVASLKLEKDMALYKGPDHAPSRCHLPNCADVPACVPPAEDSTVRFVSEARLEQRLRELMHLVPGNVCPNSKIDYNPPRPGDQCLNTGKPYTPSTGGLGKKAQVRLDSQPLRLFLSAEERTQLDSASKPLLQALRGFYASRLERARRLGGTLTARLHFPEGGFKPQVSVEQNGAGDAKLAECLGEALRSRELFSWRPAKVADLELSFVFTP